jgi:hypothetical protein
MFHKFIHIAEVKLTLGQIWLLKVQLKMVKSVVWFKTLEHGLLQVLMHSQQIVGLKLLDKSIYLLPADILAVDKLLLIITLIPPISEPTDLSLTIIPIAILV